MAPSKKNLVIAGIGEVGEHLASTFAKEGHNVTIIDTSEERLSTLQGLLDVSVCLGHAASSDVLARVGIKNADLFLATSGSDDDNIVSALKARSLGAQRTAAMVEEVEYFDDRSGIYHNWLGIDLVLNTRHLIAHEINKLIRTRGAVAVEDFAENRIEIIQFRVNSETQHTEHPLSQLSMPWECLIVAIKRGRTLIIPRGDDSIHLGDEILIMGRTDQITQLEEAFGRGSASRTKSVLLGGGTVGFVLAKSLQGIVGDISLIEWDRERCEFLSRELESVEVVHGDGTDVDLLHEVGIDSCEVFAAVSGEDERNIIAARLVKELGVGRCIALVSRPDYGDVCRHLGLEVVLSPSLIVTREVVRALMPRGILGITPIMGGKAEFMEIIVGASSEVAGKTLMNAGFPRGSVVCALLDGREFTIPKGDTTIESGMRAIIFTLTSIRPKVEKLFRL